MDDKIKTTLSNLGLDEVEISIYLILLQKGDLSQQEIAETTGLLRQTVYDRIRRLEAKGIISRTNKESKPLFLAISPEIFIEQIKEKEKQVKEILPMLDVLKLNSVNQTNSSTFTGLKALKKLIQLTLTAREEIYWIANKKISDEIFSEHFWLNYAARRNELRIPINLLIEPTTDKGWKTNKKEKRFVKTHQFVKKQQSSIIMCGEEVTLYTALNETYNGTHIKDKNLAKFFKSLFEKLWAEGKEL